MKGEAATRDGTDTAPAEDLSHHTLAQPAAIVATGRLLSDASRIAQGLDCLIVGMSEIKRRRLEELEVACHPETKVGHYVPFYFCPRSIMLYILHQANHPDLRYRGGQQPIVHLQADLQATVQWAETNAVRWAFSTSNAGAYYTNFYASLDRLGEVNWTAIEATDWRDPLIKDGKQAEFLIHDWFPWELVEKVGVFNRNINDEVLKLLSATGHAPVVNIEHG